ncbi:diguanylate cyclase domain-containing protein [Anaerolentibacter hominis]|uniref:diguanylate cyclase domain-containing protein n=1 Tax=Anaerolentibacter hominis TaxID=3079009 RepID=UPI0031B83ED4
MQNEHSREYLTLLNSIPGGVRQSFYDEEFTILEVNQGFAELFGFQEEEIRERFHNHYMEMIHPDDRDAVRETIASQLSRGDKTELQYRVICKDGTCKWVMENGQIFRDEDRGTWFMGVILDITDSQNAREELQKRAERDALTGLYNRDETERLICRQLEERPEQMCALLMIDTDNFKGVNDKQGHLFGDAVLSELAAGMKRCTRQSDVVGRIGGDEFAILLRNIPSRETAVKKAAQLLELFESLFKQGKRPVEVTCSAGVAVYPEDGADFQSLYHCADLALYKAKSLGKNRFVVFDREQAVSVDQIGYSALGAAIDSDQRNMGTAGDLISYVFQVLYDTSDIERVIALIMEIVGKRFDVSRAYVFENTEDNKYCDNTYEWCNEGIEPQKDFLQHFPYEEVDGYRDLFKHNAVFYCRDIRSLTPVQAKLFEKQGIRSTLQCAIQEDGIFHGFVGFDECTGTRMWTKEEIGVLTLISQLLSTFLLKRRAGRHDQELAVRLNTILDTQDAYIYAVEKGSYELLYLNYKTRMLDPGAKPGMTCYKAFFDRECPCENCPLNGGAGELYNSRYDVWTRTKGAPIKWDGSDAYLLTCFDITEYKRLNED